MSQFKKWLKAKLAYLYTLAEQELDGPDFDAVDEMVREAGRPKPACRKWSSNSVRIAGFYRFELRRVSPGEWFTFAIRRQNGKIAGSASARD